jgi:hypothetical protein
MPIIGIRRMSSLGAYDPDVGRSGIRHRKPVHRLPTVEEHYSDAEIGRAFGHFRWGAYTPAGSIERAGFLARQASRRKRHPEWREYNHKLVVLGSVLLLVPYVALLVVGVGALIERL